MRAPLSNYSPGLDHIRALAAFLVFSWHFVHSFDGTPVPFGPWGPFFLAPFNEGHCGVQLFMTLSGYLFAKILNGKIPAMKPFLWRRVVRLAPALLVMLAADASLRYFVYHTFNVAYVWSLLLGFAWPLWPRGGWSLAVEIQFYAVLPVIIWLNRRSSWNLLVVIACAIMIRTAIFVLQGEVEPWSGGNLLGHIDEFVFGILAFGCRDYIRGKHHLFLAAGLVFLLAYDQFVRMGGAYGTKQTPIWILMPTLTGGFFALMIAYYETTFRFGNGTVTTFFCLIGRWSYSIYLLHTFFIFQVAYEVGRHVPGGHTWPVAELASVITFIGFLPIAALSYTFVEKPFVQGRRAYAVPRVGITSTS